MTRYDAQEGAARRYDQRKSLWDNPAKRGRASHHPLMAFVADTRIIANCWLRPGNSSSANNVQVFLANTHTGWAASTSRYRCAACKATFNALTETPLAQFSTRRNGWRTRNKQPKGKAFAKAPKLAKCIARSISR